MTGPHSIQNDLAGRLAGRLEAYLALLRSEGMRIDPVQHRRVLRLLVEGLVRPDPATPERLAGQVVPILASNVQEQVTARQRFFEMFAADAPASSGLAQAPETARDKETLGRRIAVQPAFVAVIIALFVAATVAIGAWLYNSIGPNPAPARDSTAPPESYVSPRTTDAFANFIANYEIEELRLPEQSWSNRTWRWYYTEYDWRKWLAVALPLAAYLAGMALLVWLILAQLRRRRLKENLRQHALLFSTDPTRMGDRSQISLLQPLRRANEVPLRELAAGPTIEATIAAGGLLSPRYKSRTYATDFVALIDRRSRNDHLAAYAEAFIGVLEAAGLGVERFNFRDTPLMCTSVRSRTSTDLTNLITTHENAVVLVFIEELAMADSVTGRAHDWVARTNNAAMRFAVLPVARLSGRDGAFARACGFTPLECGTEGVRRLVGDLLGGSMPGRTAAAEPDHHRDLTRIVEQFALRADRWTQSTPPDAKDIQAKLNDLARVVGRDHLRWIAGTAIYPELRWSISTHLKRLSMREAGQTGRVLDDTLVAVSRLPWYRQGAMPEWVRNALIRQLHEGERSGLRMRILRALGLIPRPDGTADRLDIEVRERAPKERAPRRPADRILLDFLVPRLPAGSPLFVLPDALARRLIRRPMLVLIAAGLLSAAGAGAFTYTALSEIPINECDLWVSSTFDPNRIGPPREAEIVRKGGNHQKLLATCREAAEEYPDRLRYKFALYYLDAAIHGNRPLQLDMLRPMAAQDYPPAVNALGWHYDEGEILEPDEKKAFENYSKAANLGAHDALRNVMHLIVTSSDPKISNYENYKENFDKSIEIEKANLRNVWIHYRIGGVLKDGYEIPKSDELYLKYLTMDAERENWEALDELSWVYLHGRAGVDPDIDLARYYAEKSFDISASDSSADILARIYASEDRPDPERVFYMTMFAAKFGDTDAIKRVRRMLLNDEIEADDANVESVIDGWKSLLQGDDRESMFALGEEILEATSPDSRYRKIALNLFARSAELGHESSVQYEHLWVTDAELRELIAGTDEERLYALGDRIYWNSPEESERRRLALDMLKRAAALGHPSAEREYGHRWITDAELRELIAGTDEERLYALGERIYWDSPEESDRRRLALDMLKRAAALGHPYAESEYEYLWVTDAELRELIAGTDEDRLYALGDRIYWNSPEESERRRLARDMLKRAAALGHPSAEREYEYLWITDAELRELIAGTDDDRLYALGPRIYNNSAADSDRQRLGLNMLKRAAELDHPYAETEYGHLWITDAELWVLVAGTDEDRLYALGQRIYNNSPAGSDRERLGVSMLKRAAALGHPDAESEYEHLWITDAELWELIAGTDDDRLYMLGPKIYSNSPAGSDRERLGLSMLKRAAALGHPDAESEYGHLWADTR